MHSLHGAVLCVLAAAVVMQCDAAITCLDEGGKPVDWFIVYKLPIIRNSSSKQVQQGYGYMYMDVRQTALKLSKTGLNTANHAIAHTLQQIYSNHGSSNVGYLMYSDGLPNSKKGHTKGQQLMYNYPWIYDFNIPPELAKNVPSLVKAAHGNHVTSAPWNRRVPLTSSGGQSFDSFAKFSNYGQDIYSAWLAPFLKSNLLVETWQNGQGKKMNSSCGGPYNVENIRAMKLGSEHFRQTKDHSKWAVTAPSGSKWICIGDINRMESQKKRGGGALCFENAAAHKNFLDGITDIEKCNLSRRNEL
ncbi:plancitoxin-1-like isoform X2 [Asterias amurensis]|uniref:plancitoxin-1-like isoform X2 n=1 Tax=Asterias amurensis TaxID=7602 RepID=UPI003AB20D43